LTDTAAQLAEPLRGRRGRTIFRISLAGLVLCAEAGPAAAQAQLLQGRWVPEKGLALLSFDFRGGDTVWALIPIAAITAQGRGTYDYTEGRIVLHSGESLYDTVMATLRGDTLMLAFADGRKETDIRVASARGAQSTLHGTWVGPYAESQLKLMTYLPGGLFFQEAAFVTHYTVDGATVTITSLTGSTPNKFRLKISGNDTLLVRLDSAGTAFTRPRCNEPRLDPRTSFTSACS
jgi:hypothetical protein